MQSHMSLETCIDVLRANNLTTVNNIVLIHLSDSNSNAMQCLKSVQKQTHKNITIAHRGIVIPFNKTPF